MDCFDSNIDNDDTFDDSDNEEVCFMYGEEDIYGEEEFFRDFDDVHDIIYDDDFDFSDLEECDGYDDEEFARDLDEAMAMAEEHPRFIARPISVRKGTVDLHRISVGHIRNRIYVNSTFKAMSTAVSGVHSFQGIDQCVFINCTWISSNIDDVFIENTKFINCTFHDSELRFSLMKNVTFENCTFINSRNAYDDYESNVNMINSTFFEIYEIV